MTWVCLSFNQNSFNEIFQILNLKAKLSVLLTDTEKRVEMFLRGYDEEKLKSLKFIIYTCPTISEDLKILAQKYKIELINYDDFINLGKKNVIQPSLVNK